MAIQETDDKGQEVTDLETKIIKQIEYYFSEINLSRDKFMNAEMTKDNGWVQLSVLLTFNRLKSLSSEADVIIKALKKSDAGLVEISEDETKLRRSPANPLPEFNDEYKQELNERTVHLKGFPEDASLEDITQFCSQYGKVLSIEMRRTKEKKFKGCIFVVYSTKEEADNAIKPDGNQPKFNDQELKSENKNQYHDRKKEYLESLRSRKQSKNSSPSKDPKKKAEDEENKEEATKEDEDVVAFKGAVLKLKSVPKDTNFDEIKKFFGQHATVRFVEIKEDTNEAFIRFDEENGAVMALEKAKVKTEDEKAACVDLKGENVEAEVITGEEEKAYWTILKEFRSNYKPKKKIGGGGSWNRKNRKGYQGGGRRGNKRSGGDHDSHGHRNKSQKND